jgi:hypothetical protein
MTKTLALETTLDRQTGFSLYGLDCDAVNH